MRRLIAVAGIIALASGCADSTSPLAVEPQYTIDVAGNTVGSSGYAILDQHFKLLYEINSMAVRRGEAEYNLVSNANMKLGWIFLAEQRTADQAVRSLDQFIRTITRAAGQDRYSACWGDYVLAYAEWLRGKVVNRDLDVSSPPTQSCRVSPVNVSGSGTSDEGVTLTIDDPWHYSGDPYDAYSTTTWLVVTGPQGTIMTEPTAQSGPAVLTVVDAATTEIGMHQYSVMQCSDWAGCSEPVLAEVLVSAVSQSEKKR